MYLFPGNKNFVELPSAFLYSEFVPGNKIVNKRALKVPKIEILIYNTHGCNLRKNCPKKRSPGRVNNIVLPKTGTTNK